MQSLLDSFLIHPLLAALTFAKRHPLTTLAVLVVLFFVGNLSAAIVALTTMLGIPLSRQVFEWLSKWWLKAALGMGLWFIGWRKVALVVFTWSLLDLLWPERGMKAKEVSGTPAATPAAAPQTEEEWGTFMNTWGGFWTSNLAMRL
jgi:hypothetical protein